MIEQQLSLSVPFNCHFLFRILCRDAIIAPPKKKRKTTESTTTDIHVFRPRTPRSTRSVYQRSSATVLISNNTTDSNIPILAENNTGTTTNMNIDYTRLAEEIIRLQNSGNRNTMGGVQPASSGNICTDSLTATTSSFLASDTEFSSGQLRSQDDNYLTSATSNSRQ